jgi:hypothetical protein
MPGVRRQNYLPRVPGSFYYRLLGHYGFICFVPLLKNESLRAVFLWTLGPDRNLFFPGKKNKFIFKNCFT